MFLVCFYYMYRFWYVLEVITQNHALMLLLIQIGQHAQKVDVLSLGTAFIVETL